jgi:hypothetical protein
MLIPPSKISMLYSEYYLIYSRQHTAFQVDVKLSLSLTQSLSYKFSQSYPGYKSPKSTFPPNPLVTNSTTLPILSSILTIIIHQVIIMSITSTLESVSNSKNLRLANQNHSREP